MTNPVNLSMQRIENFFSPKYASENIDFAKTTEALQLFGSVSDPENRTQRLVLQVKRDQTTEKLILEAKKYQDITWRETIVGFFTGSFRISNIFTVFQRVMEDMQKTGDPQNLASRFSDSIQQHRPNDSMSLGDSLVTCSVLFHREGVRDTKDFLKFLVDECHVNINKLNGLGRTPLIEAIIQHKDRIKENTLLMRFLVDELWANPFKKEPYLRCFNNHLLRNNLEKCQTLINKKFEIIKNLGLIWGLKGHIEHLNLEESLFQRGLSRIQPLISDFCEQVEMTRELSAEEIKKFSQAFAHGITIEPFFGDFDPPSFPLPEPFIISDGFNLNNHFVGVVIYKNQIAVCNRGYGTTNSGAEIFQLKQPLTSDILKGLLSKKVISEFNQELISLSHENVTKLDQKKQKVGNCGWASLKTTVHALLYMLLKERSDLSEEAVRQKSRSLYKSFATFSRMKILEEYLNTVSPHQKVLQKVSVKVEQHKNRFSPEQYAHLSQLLAKQTRTYTSF